MRYIVTMSEHEKSAPPLAPRIALLSIGGFWLLYFVIGSLRSLVVYHDPEGMFGARLLVSILSIGVTAILYLVMRQVPAARLTRAILVAAVLAVPAAALYSTFNWFVFNQVFHMGPRGMGPHHHHGPPPAMDGAAAGDAPPGSLSVSVGRFDAVAGHPAFRDIADQAFNGYFFFIAWLALYLAMCYAAEIGALERHAADLRSSAQAAELRALRYQVNPHFLFNALNALSSLVLSGRNSEAENMIQNLSGFFRSSLTADPARDIPLSFEIELQRLYLDIEAVRFPKRLAVTIDVPEQLGQCCVPGLILQPIVENAVKYGVARARRTVTIRITAREDAGRLALVVEDDGELFPPAAGGTGIGLQNVRDRLAARYAELADCSWEGKSAGGFAVRLNLPVIRDGC